MILPTPQSVLRPSILAATYQVATTDFRGLIAAGYRKLFAQATPPNATGIDLRDQIRAYLQTSSPVSAARDGRITLEPPPAPSAVTIAPSQPADPIRRARRYPCEPLQSCMDPLLSLARLRLQRYE